MHNYWTTNLKKLIVSVVLILLLIHTLTIAGEYFAGDAADIYDLISTILPGDTLTLRNGIWEDQQIVFHANGTEESPILFRAEKPGYVRIIGNSFLEFSGNWITVDGLLFRNGYCNSGQGVVEFRSRFGPANNCRLTNTVIADYNPANKDIDYKWVSLYGKNNRVDHCHFEGKLHSGTTLVVWLSASEPENYHRIDHNYFGPRPPLGYNGGETIRIGTSDYSLSNSYSIVEYNVFEECSGETEIISNKSCENIYQYNTFINCEGCLTLRHGNRCIVRGNFFFGNRSGDTGGVRIIGEDHQVYNNYFEGLNGAGYSSALCIVKGVQNSPLNRYFQVKRARVTFNTFINCRNTLLIGYGSSDDQTLPPIDCIIANNAIQTDYQVARIGDTEGVPVNFLWEGNIVFGSSLGINNPGGITWQNPDLILADDGLFRPTSSSPLIDAAVGDYTYITTDLDGQIRTQPYDVGCDEISSEPILNVPLSRQDVGVDWYISGPVAVEVSEGENTLLDALNLLGDNDTLKLITDGGIYQLSEKIIVDRKIIIRAAKGFINQPVITRSKSNNVESALFEMHGLGELYLDGVTLDGGADIENELNALIATSELPFSEYFRIKANNCQFFSSGSSGILKLFPGTQADSVIIHNCIFSNCDDNAIQADGEEEGSGKYNVQYLEIYNCTFWNIGGEAISIYAGDDIPYSIGPIIRIDHCTFDDCGKSKGSVVHLREVDNGIISNSIFSNSRPDTAAVIIYGWSYIEYCDIFHSGDVRLVRGAHQYDGMVDLDPKYADPANGNFTLAYSSPVRGIAKDNEAMGDLRWAVEVENSVWLSESNHINGFVLHQNYPNPFNNETWISFSLSKPATVELQIFNLNGTQVTQMRNGYCDAGNYSITWTPEFISSGVYICRLIAGNNSNMIKMMYLK